MAGISTDWANKKKITLTGQTGAGTGYQVKLLVGESSGAVGEDFDLGSNSDDFPAVKGDGGDLRFSDSDNTETLDFWVEEVSGTTPNRLAHVWVQVTDDLGSNVDIYIYYGNSGTPTNGSDGDLTFLTFDDFEGASLDTAKWDSRTLASSITVGSDVVHLDDSGATGSFAGIYTKSDVYGFGYAVMSRFQRTGTTAYGNFGLGLCDVASKTANRSPDIAISGLNFQADVNHYHSGGTTTKIINAQYTLNTYYRNTLKKISSTKSIGSVTTDTFTAYGSTTTITDGAYTNDDYIEAFSSGGADAKYDWIAVRNVIDGTEPDFSSAGAEEANTGASTNSNFLAFM